MPLSLLLPLTAAMLMAAGPPSLSASDTCQEEMSLLHQQETLLRTQLQRQEALLQRLKHSGHQGAMERGGAAQSPQRPHEGCSSLFTSGYKSSGSYSIRPSDSSSPIKVYCDMSEGGGWTVLQRRTGGEESFNRSWADYKSGFGDMESDTGEFWLGNDVLHSITAHGNFSLRIQLEDFEGNQRYAEYQNLRVADEENQYQLSFGAYTGTAGDALSGHHRAEVSSWASHQDMKFSTYDRDNDNYKGNCALEDSGGWWFNRCHTAHLNGLYYPSGPYSALTDNGMVWYPWRGWWYSLKTSIMKIRPTDFKIDPDDDPNAVHLDRPS